MTNEHARPVFRPILDAIFQGPPRPAKRPGYRCTRCEAWTQYKCACPVCGEGMKKERAA